MAIAYVRDTGKIRTTGTGQTSNASFGALPSVGNTIIVGVSSYFAGQNNGAMGYSDNQGNSYSSGGADIQVGSGPTDDDESACIGSAAVGTSAGTFTVTVDASGTTNTFYTWMAVEFSGLASSAFDKSSSNSEAGGSTTIGTGTTPTLSQAEELVVSVCALNTGVNHTSVTASGYTALWDEPDGTSFAVGGMAYKTVSSTSGVSATWNWTTNSSTGEGAVIATYLGGTPPPPAVPVSNMGPPNFPPNVFPGAE